MTLYTQAQSQSLMKAAGFTDAQAEIAAAISMCEAPALQGSAQYTDSARVGDITLVNSTWGPSYSILQIRSLKDEYGTGQFRDAERLATDPAFVAKSGHQVFLNAGGSFTPWSTFTSGAYKAFMTHATYNPPTVVPQGTVLVTSGDTLSGIGGRTGYSWQLIAAVNHIAYPYTIFIGQSILLPDWNYTVQSGDYLGMIAAKYSTVTWHRIAEYNNMANPNILSVGQKLKIPRYTSWDGHTLV